MGDFAVEINGLTLEYVSDGHQYLIDGVCVPSITQIMRLRFGGKYAGVDRDTLMRAAQAGTEVHEAIEDYCVNGTESDLPEVRGFRFLQKHYGFRVMGNEVPVILYYHDEPRAAGRLDLVLCEGDKIGLADIKRTSSLDKDYLSYQLTLYKRAFEWSHGVEVEFLRGLHLREQTRKYVPIPACDELVDELLDEYFKE